MNDFQQEWVAVDWGTTHFRVWRMSGADVIEGREASCGLLALQKINLNQLWSTTFMGGRLSPVLMSGMVGSRQGWQEAPIYSCQSH